MHSKNIAGKSQTQAPYPKKVCFEALIVVFHFLFEQKPAPAPSFLLNNNKDKQFKKGTELLSSKLLHSCQSLSIDRYAKGCVTSFLSSVFKFHLTLLHPVAERAKIASSALQKNIYISFTNFKPDVIFAKCNGEPRSLTCTIAFLLPTSRGS